MSGSGVIGALTFLALAGLTAADVTDHADVAWYAYVLIFLTGVVLMENTG